MERTEANPVDHFHKLGSHHVIKALRIAIDEKLDRAVGLVSLAAFFR
jgi:hypothetical protein